MDERDFNRRLLFSGNHYVDRLGVEGGGADEAGCDITVETTVGAGEDEQLFTQIEDVDSKREKGYKKNAEKQGLSFLKQIRGSHD